MRNKKLMLGLLILTCVLPVLWAGAIDWIQYNERLSGENSPFYDDILNRPAKEIWGNFTSEHNADGSHRSWIFPTPIPTATPQPTPTPIPSNALIDWTDATANFKTTGAVDASAQAIFLKIYVQETTAPDIPSNTMAFWVDSYTAQYYLILDYNGVQKQIELTTP